MAVITVKDKNGNNIEIPALRGARGPQGKRGRDGVGFFVVDEFPVNPLDNILYFIGNDMVTYMKKDGVLQRVNAPVTMSYDENKEAVIINGVQVMYDGSKESVVLMGV